MTVSPVAAPVRGAGAPSGPAWRWLGSLRLRLLAATLASLLLALAAAHGWLAAQFREHVLAQFDLGLVQQLDQLTARLVVDAAGRPEIGPRGMSDPRWEQVYSGLYWQVERLPAPAGPGLPALRSRSLWDAVLRLPDDARSAHCSAGCSRCARGGPGGWPAAIRPSCSRSSMPSTRCWRARRRASRRRVPRRATSRMR
ncbi:hypothetical protein ABXN37_27130 [Piscinibacter sakaiensis]|uniref:hypothetical protein n=1 Tax=Piscinibacter sakaiensis TaxID=1547922 RepID=UPI003729DD88